MTTLIICKSFIVTLLFTSSVLTGLILSFSCRWKIFFCMTGDTTCSVILEVPLTASKTLRQRGCQSWRRKSKSEFSELFIPSVVSLSTIQKLIGLILKPGTLLCHTALQRWSTSMVERSSPQRQTFG